MLHHDALLTGEERAAGVGLRVDPGPAAPSAARVAERPALLDLTLPEQRAGRLAALTRTKAAAPRWQREHARRVLVGDAAAGVVASVVSALVWQAVGRPSAAGLVLLAAFAPVWVAALVIGRAYEPRYLLSGGLMFKRLADTGLYVLAAAAVVAAVDPHPLARLVALLAVPASVLLGVAVRGLARARLHARRAAGEAMHRVLVVGSRSSVHRMAQLCAQDSSSAFAFVGALVAPERVDGLQVTGPAGDVPVVGTPRDAAEAVRAYSADTVLVASGVDAEELTRLSIALEGLGADLYVAPNLSGVSGPRLSMRPFGGVPLLHVDEPELSGPRRLLKSVFDRASAAAGLVVLSPVLAVIALMVRLDSPGPVIFKQQRVGRAGQPFTMWKFRSMVVDAEERRKEIEHLNDHGDDHVLFKMKDDPRVTRMGRLLRRTSLDELPQLVNVLRGEMSLVGPRPPLPSEVERYVDTTTRRLLVRPGLTGLWQVSGRAELSWDESLRLDLHYVENWSVFLDLQILWRTLSVVLRRDGAY